MVSFEKSYGLGLHCILSGMAILTIRAAWTYRSGAAESLRFGCLIQARITPKIVQQKQALANHLEEPADG